MFSHQQVWAAIDALAKNNGLSTSGLAKKAGLDATSFNKSKRKTAEGRSRWPSTESIAKVLECTGTRFEDFVALVTGSAGMPHHNVPLIGMVQAGRGGFFDDAGFPVGASWEEIRFPGIDDENIYALEVTGDSMLPVYRDGDRVIVSPNSPVRRGDRVVAKTTDGQVLVKVLERQTESSLELASFNPAHPTIHLPMSKILWIARVLWVSQ